MNPLLPNYPAIGVNTNLATPSHSTRGRPRGSTNAKRGRKPRGGSTAESPRDVGSPAGTSSPQFSHVHWAVPAGAGDAGDAGGSSVLQGDISRAPSTSAVAASPTATMRSGAGGEAPLSAGQTQQPQVQASVPGRGVERSLVAPGPSNLLSLPGMIAPLVNAAGTAQAVLRPGVDEVEEGEDELLPAMADDDYSAQLSWQSQSKDNLKVLMENLSPAQYDRFEAYRRHALPKQAVRKVIQQTVGLQASQPVAQIVAGFAKVFVGEIVEKARRVQERRGETGPLSPDHLREAYRSYQEESGRVGAARPLRSKRLFVR